jgi:Nitrile hydratase, alpha chain
MDTQGKQKKWARVIAQAWADEEFKAKLLADPAAVLAANGIEIPQGMTIQVVEQKKNEILMPLPPEPSSSFTEVTELDGRLAATSSASHYLSCQ